MISQFSDRTYLLFAGGSIASSAATYLIFRQYFVKYGGVWSAPMFVPIQTFILVVFAINIFLSFVAYKKDHLISFAFNFSTIIINLLLIVAMVLNLSNPNG